MLAVPALPASQLPGYQSPFDYQEVFFGPKLKILGLTPCSTFTKRSFGCPVYKTLYEKYKV
jgi:hypothetical protein